MEDNHLIVNGEPVQTEVLDDASFGTEAGGDGTCAIYNPKAAEPADPVEYCECIRQRETSGERVYVTQHMSGRGHRSLFSCRNDPDWPLRNPARGGPCGYYGGSRENPDWPDVVIPEGHVFVMGDNRDRSEDGRYWGVVPHDMIKGRAFIIWYAYDVSRVFNWLG